MTARKLLKEALVIIDVKTPVQKSDLLIEEGLIKATLPPGTQVADAEEFDFSDHLIHPGFVNVHVHSHASMTRGMADNWTLELLLTAGAGIYGQRLNADKYLSAVLGGAELLLKGTTAVYDMSLEVPLPTPEGMGAVAKAYSDLGMKALIAPMVSDVSLYHTIPGVMERLPADLREKFAVKGSADAVALALDKVIKSWNQPESIMLGLAPTIPLHCSDELWKKVMDLAGAHYLPVQCHLAESNVQARSGLSIYGCSLTQHLEKLGVLNERFTGSHGVWLSDDDMLILGYHGCGIAHNPGSNMVLGNGLADVRAMLEAGIRVGIGTDGSNCGILNMYDSVRQALYVSHVQKRDTKEWLSCREVFEMATEGGASLLGWKDIGSLRKGMKADLVVLDLKMPQWMPLNDPINQLVQSEDGTAVRHVMVDGQWVVKDRELVNIDLADLYAKAQEANRRLAEKNREARSAYKRLAPIVSDICCGFMRFNPTEQSRNAIKL